MQLFKSASQQDLNPIVNLANSIWPSGHLWIDGKNGLECSIIYSHYGNNFVETKRPCYTGSYFFCEYKRKYFESGTLNDLKLSQKVKT